MHTEEVPPARLLPVQSDLPDLPIAFAQELARFEDDLRLQEDRMPVALELSQLVDLRQSARRNVRCA